MEMGVLPVAIDCGGGSGGGSGSGRIGKGGRGGPVGRGGHLEVLLGN